MVDEDKKFIEEIEDQINKIEMTDRLRINLIHFIYSLSIDDVRELINILEDIKNERMN